MWTIDPPSIKVINVWRLCSRCLRNNEIARGGVSLRISSKIYPRSLFSLTPNVIGRYRNFNCSMVSFRSRQI
ncbi:hypothetical protein T07_12106 [Trichinella nelsoni]|uniref:Uncharacterized protein n=1 Tax=Trichinella nelsoni TaxID=6336 RepID=A0A0V0RDK6_9BILA|nr:hypothetical protein T07_12106 [Trichinella nelsoni]